MGVLVVFWLGNIGRMLFCLSIIFIYNVYVWLKKDVKMVFE